MFHRLGQFVAKRWLVVILFWGALAATIRYTAPRWDDVTRDGDLAYLPERMTSVRGEKLLAAAFPDNRAKSQMALVFARAGKPLTVDDLAAADIAAGRFHFLHGAARSETLQKKAATLSALDLQEEQAEIQAAYLRAVALLGGVIDSNTSPRLVPLAMHYRAEALAAAGQAEPARADRERLAQVAPGFRPPEFKNSTGFQVRGVPLVEVWDRSTEHVGEKLARLNDREEEIATLVVGQLSNEFMAAENVAVLERVRQEVAAVESAAAPGLQIGVTGSAAVGGDTQTAALESVRNTETWTIILVLIILLVVYRAPVLVVIPLLTIGVSVVVATGFVAGLTQVEALNFMIFKTTKIFIVVILFGAGTDFCLFLIARYREELERGLEKGEALAHALGQVGEALVGSALTTILGLGMMFFADFGKFRNSGPSIALCLAVALLACLTLAPALLRAMGRLVYWPFGVQVRSASADTAATMTMSDRFWDRLSRIILARPGLILVVSLGAMAPLAYSGLFVEPTFNLPNDLPRDSVSIQGSDLLKEYFSIGDSGPITILAWQKGYDFNADKSAGVKIRDLTKVLYDIAGDANRNGIVDELEPRENVGQIDARLKAARRAAENGPDPAVVAVRGRFSPLGDWPEKAGGETARKKYVTQVAELGGGVVRFDVITNRDPFSRDSVALLTAIESHLVAMAQNPDSKWAGAEFDFLGTTPGVRDLKAVTASDQRLIQMLVTLAVLGVLIVLLRKPLICLYLILTVLFSYFVTVGATELVFAWLYQGSFEGLDWKVPIFLFVILVAIGEDYNIYLATRVLEEQRRYGLLEGLRRAVVRTGGIITSCGIIMAGTFISMMTGSLRAMLELGFALSVGVLLDTCIVRPVLVPAFLALLYRGRSATDTPAPPTPSEADGSAAKDEVIGELAPAATAVGSTGNPPPPHIGGRHHGAVR